MNQKKTTLNDKLTVVLSLLEESKQEYRSVEKSVQDKELRVAILQLIEKDIEYANNLSGFVKPIEKNKAAMESSFSLVSSHIYSNSEKKTLEKDLIEKINQSECTLEKAYRQVLNSDIKQEELKELMVTQLNGIKCTFVKLKIKCLIMNKKWNPSFRYNT